MMLGSPMGLGMVPQLHPDVWGVQKIQITNFIMTNNNSSMKYALKSVPGLDNVGVPHGVGDGPRTPPRCLRGPKKIQMTNFTMPNNTSSMKYSQLRPYGPPLLAPAGVSFWTRKEEEAKLAQPLSASLFPVSPTQVLWKKKSWKWKSKLTRENRHQLPN